MPFHTELQSVADLKTVLKKNPSWVILKFTATWCGPCKKLEPLVNPLLQTLSQQNVEIYILDIDENFEIYGYLKNKRRLHGIPAMLAYKKGNEDIIPDHFISGTNPQEIQHFFEMITFA